MAGQEQFDILTYAPHLTQYIEELNNVFTNVYTQFQTETAESGMSNFINYLHGKLQENESFLNAYTNSPIINGLFLKIYNCNLAVQNWPPLDYPTDAPLLVYVPGYHGESSLEWCMRILNKIGYDHVNGYNLTDVSVRFIPDMSGYPNILPFENQWRADAHIRQAFDYISGKLRWRGRVPNLRSYVNAPDTINNEGIITAYSNVGAIYADTICSDMNDAGRLFSRIRNHPTFDDFYNSHDRLSTEFEIQFVSPAWLQHKLTRHGLPWAQQLFVILGPNDRPKTMQIGVLDGVLNVRDTVWIKLNVAPKGYEANRLTVIQGAFMATYKPFTQAYFGGVKAISTRLLSSIRDEETVGEKQHRLILGATYSTLTRSALNTLISSIPFTLDGKQPYIQGPSPIANVQIKKNLQKLRTTFKKPSWHFWNKGPDSLIRELMGKYGNKETFKDIGIIQAAAALKRHHTNANKDALVDAFEAAINNRKTKSRYEIPTAITDYVSLYGQLNEMVAELNKSFFSRRTNKVKEIANNLIPLFNQKGDFRIVAALHELTQHPTKSAIDEFHFALLERQRSKQPRNNDFGGTNYSGFEQKLNELREELGKSFFQRTLFKSSRLVKEILERYEPEFRKKGDEGLIAAMTELRKFKDGRSATLVKDALEARYLRRNALSRGLPVERISDGVRVLSVPFASQSQMRPYARPLVMPPVMRSVMPPVMPPVMPTDLTDLNTSDKLDKLDIRMPTDLTGGITGLNTSVPAMSGPISLPTNVSLGAGTGLQFGGWSPTLMAGFATNGLRLLPVAGYMGYKMFKKTRKQAKARKNKTRRNKRNQTQAGRK